MSSANSISEKRIVRNILVHRLGSMGDFIVAVPCFHLLRRSYPQAKIVLITNHPVSGKAAPAMEVAGRQRIV